MADTMGYGPDDVLDRPHEACGVFGIYAPEADAARMTFFALYALQHRGQESTGIATSDGRAAYFHKGMGLVSQVFNEDNLRPLKGHLAIGHNRYSTTGSSHLRNAQPYLIETMHGPLGVGHNGNLTNALSLRRDLLERGVGLISTSDSEVITQMLAAPPPGGEPRRPGLGSAHRRLHGAGRRRLLAGDPDARSRLRRARPMGVAAAVHRATQPRRLRLCGRLRIVRAAHHRGALPARGPAGRDRALGRRRSAHDTGHTGPATKALCVFEYVYFARPDSELEGQIVHRVRQRLGEELAREAPVAADMVIGVPDSATPAAIGYAGASGIPYTEGLTKNRYIGRTFIQPDDRLRQLGVHLKFNPLTANLAGKRVVLVDDSIVRGHTAGRSSSCCARAAPPRCTCASRHRRCATRVSWALTWRPTTS